MTTTSLGLLKQAAVLIVGVVCVWVWGRRGVEDVAKVATSVRGTVAGIWNTNVYVATFVWAAVVASAAAVACARTADGWRPSFCLGRGFGCRLNRRLRSVVTVVRRAAGSTQTCS